MAEQLLNGRYQLLRPLGTGGMASVYLAEDLRLGRRVALKILHPQFAADPSFVARFEGEARMAAALSHPNIVQVFDVGHDGDRYYIVMQYVEGATLKDAITRQGAFPVARALTVISGVLAALEFAHAHNLIHRDIKSQNILITPDGDVKVADFGIARELGAAATPTLTATGMVIGTVQYFSPEQAQGRQATTQSDIYAAGVVLYEMLTGQLPFDADNPFAVAMQQINAAPPPPATLNSAIPPAVEAIVLKALSKNPAARYASAREMRLVVDGALRGASEPTRLSTQPVAVASATPRPASPRHVAPPGVTRPARVAPGTNTSAPAPSGPVKPRAPRGTWIVVGTLAALLALFGGFYFVSSHSGGGGAAATATPSATTAPMATDTVPPVTATSGVVVVPLTPTPTALAPTGTAIPTATGTAIPTATGTAIPTATGTAIPTATDTAVPPTDTVAPTATPAPSATPVPPTDTAAPSDTAVPTAVPSDTPAPPETPAPRPSATPVSGVTPATQGTAGPVAISLEPPAVRPGDTFSVTGRGWPPGDTVTISADFGENFAPLDRVTVRGDGSLGNNTFQLPGDVSAAIVEVKAEDGQGNSASQRLTVSS